MTRKPFLLTSLILAANAVFLCLVVKNYLAAVFAFIGSVLAFIIPPKI